jgi:hypothetical protein
MGSERMRPEEPLPVFDPMPEAEEPALIRYLREVLERVPPEPTPTPLLRPERAPRPRFNQD